jgi:HEAT repeat protein
MARPSRDDTDLMARVRENEAIVAALRDQAGMAKCLAAASREEALRVIESIGEWHGPDPVLEEQFCLLLDLGDETLSSAIFEATTLSPKNHGLVDRATAALDSPSPKLRAAALSAIGMGDLDLLAIPGLRDKIASLAGDADDGVRQCVAFALGCCSPDVVVPMLEDPSDHVRYAALSTLVDVPQYARLAETVALRLVLDSSAEPGPRLDAADFLRTEEERRDAHAFLASHGIGDAPKPGDRFFSGAQRGGKSVN